MTAPDPHRLSVRFSVLTNALALLAIAFVLLRPTGPLARALSEKRSELRIARVLSEEWPGILLSGANFGSGDQPVGLLVFTDFGCPHCALVNRTLIELVEAEGSIGVSVRYLPLQGLESGAGVAAKAAACAEAQGHLVEMHSRVSLLGLTQWRWDWESEGQAAGIPDLHRFLACLEEERTADRIRDDMALAQRLGVRGVPTLFTPSGMLEGSQPVEDFLRTVGR
jgi:protein-disulfide isomerase